MEESRQVNLVPSFDADKTPDTSTLMVTESPPLVWPHKGMLTLMNTHRCWWKLLSSSVQFSSVTQSCLTLRDLWAVACQASLVTGY